MKIAWSTLKSAVLEVFNFYKWKNCDTWTAEVKSVYTKYYRTVERQTEEELSSDAADDWDEFARKAVFQPASRFDNKSLQVQGIDGSNRWVERLSN
jgi:hypothetical protein